MKLEEYGVIGTPQATSSGPAWGRRMIHTVISHVGLDSDHPASESSGRMMVSFAPGKLGQHF